MDLTNLMNVIGYADPIEMPVSELLTGSYSFNIPSYQRGYRWESSEEGAKECDSKQVDDLLNDLTAFAREYPNQSANYYLQPLMVKPHVDDAGICVWDVLDGQQRLTTMLLILKCINEKLYPASQFPLYSLRYENRRQLDFSRITFDINSADYDYPSPSDSLDSYFIRKAKDRIGRWYNDEVSVDTLLQDKMKEMLFYADASRGSKSRPPLRAKFIWYNVQPVSSPAIASTESRIQDIEIFNRLNRGKISLTESELIKAMLMLSIKKMVASAGKSFISADTLARKWDDMEKKLQDDSFWEMMVPKDKEYSNRMDFLFDFIRECNGWNNTYRHYYDKLNDSSLNPSVPEGLWNEIKIHFDTLCKWHEDVHKHNCIGYLVDCGMKAPDIYKELKKGSSLNSLLKTAAGVSSEEDIDDLSYQDDYSKIRRILLLFNVLTCDKFSQKFPFDLFRRNSYDIEHVNSQTDNPIESIEDKKEWIREHALSCLEEDQKEADAAQEVSALMSEGEQLLECFERDGRDVGDKFKPYRIKVENYYACGDTAKAMANKDSIGNLTLLNFSINREYKNALFPKKLRTLKRKDQEGVYIPLCTKYMFLKYYSTANGNASAFSMMRWKPSDQKDYTNAIKDVIKTVL